MSVWYVYGLFDEDCKMIYVGCTRYCPSRRMKAHAQKNSVLCRRFNKKLPKLTYLILRTCFSAEEGDQYEQEMYLKHRPIGNGKTHTGRYPTWETRPIRKQSKKRPTNGARIAA